MIKMLPLLGLVIPPILYLIFFGISSSAFSAIGLTADNMLIGVIIISVIVWLWSAAYARSANKFFTKSDKGNFKKAFGVNSLPFSAQIFIWLFINTLFGTGNPFTAVLICLLIMFFGGNALRLWLTMIVFDVPIKTSANANKVNLIFETLIYVPLFFISFTMSGVF